jgi:hypothetical protein
MIAASLPPASPPFYRSSALHTVSSDIRKLPLHHRNNGLVMPAREAKSSEPSCLAPIERTEAVDRISIDG